MALSRALTLEAGAELLKALRSPEFVIPTLFFPVAFYTMFAVVLPSNAESAAYLLATYGVFAVMGPSIFGFGVAVASEREKGWLELKRAAPTPAFSFVAAKVLSTLIFASLAVALVYIIAGFAADVRLPRATWVMLLLVHILATLPFILIGLSIGFTFKANASVAIANLLFMGLAILGGLWIPVFLFPDSLQAVSKLLPTYHLGEIALAVSGAPGERDIAWHVAVISAMTIALAALTTYCWRRQ